MALWVTNKEQGDDNIINATSPTITSPTEIQEIGNFWFETSGSHGPTVKQKNNKSSIWWRRKWRQGFESRRRGFDVRSNFGHFSIQRVRLDFKLWGTIHLFENQVWIFLSESLEWRLAKKEERLLRRWWREKRPFFPAAVDQPGLAAVGLLSHSPTSTSVEQVYLTGLLLLLHLSLPLSSEWSGERRESPFFSSPSFLISLSLTRSARLSAKAWTWKLSGKAVRAFRSKAADRAPSARNHHPST